MAWPTSPPWLFIENFFSQTAHRRLRAFEYIFDPIPQYLGEQIFQILLGGILLRAG
jgi:hypothetical protein